MDILFVILMLVSLGCLVAGLIKPSIFSKTFSRKKAFVYFGLLFIACFVLVGVFADNEEPIIEKDQNQPSAMAPTTPINNPLVDDKPTTEPEELQSVAATPKPAAPKPEPKSPELIISKSECVSGQININNASREDLILIKHIGPERVESLIKLRPFKSVDGLSSISGIGPERLKEIKEQGLACV